MNYFEDEELPLLTFNPNLQNLEINQKSLEVFSNFNRPFSVLSIIGQRNSGKSYFLNRVISNRTKGFSLCSGKSSDLPGIYLWGKPMNFQKSGEDASQSVFLIDFQNFPDFLGPALEQIYRLLSIFTVFMSSCLVINIKSIEGLFSILNDLSQLAIKCEKKSELKVFILFRDRQMNCNIQELENKMESLFREFEKKDSVIRFMQNREYIFLPSPILDSIRSSLSFEKSLEDVNPEFIIEVMKVRTKLLSASPIHTLNTQTEFTGIIYANFLNFLKEELFLKKNNKGRRFVYKEIMEDFISKETQGLFKDSIELYEFHIKEEIVDKLPLNSQDLQKIHKGIKIAVFEFFQQRFLEKDSLHEYSNMLCSQIKEKYKSLKSLNEQESQKMLSAFIMKEFQCIDKKLKQKDYDSFEDYEKELKIFHSFYLENAPELPQKTILILDFLYRALIEGVNYLFPQDLKISFAKSDDFSTTIKEKNTFVQNSLEKVLSEPKSLTHTLTEELDKQHKSINSIQIEDLEKELSQLKRDYELLRLENRRLEAESKASLSLRFKMNEFEENMKEKNRDTLVLESEYRKELALLRQKLEFHEKTIEDLTRKSRDHNQEVKIIKSSHYTEIKELTLKYETLNHSLEFEVKQLKDKTHDLQQELENSNAKLSKEKDNSKLAEDHFKAIIQEDNLSLKELRRELQEFRNKDIEKTEKMKTFHEKSLEELNETLKTVEENCRLKEKAYKELKMLYDRDKAVLSQKVEFLEMELKEIKEKKSENTSIQDAFIKALELSEEYAKNPKNEENLERLKNEVRGIEEMNRMLKGKVEGKEKEIEEIKRLKNRDAEEIRNLQNQIYELRSHNERLRIETNDCQSLFTSELEKIIMTKESVELQYSDLKSKYLKEQSLWSEKYRVLNEDLEDAERKLQLALKLREEEKEITSRNHANLLESIEKKHCRQMNEISGFYENKMVDCKKKPSFLESKNYESGKIPVLSTLSSLNSLTSILEISKLHNNKLNQETIDLEKESLKNKIYELEQALNDSEARRELQKSELKREKSRQNLTIHENPRADSKVLKKSINIYNTLQNPITSPKGQSLNCSSYKVKSPCMKENNKRGFHSKKQSYTEKSITGLVGGEAGNHFSVNDLGILSNRNTNKSFLLNPRNSSLEEQDFFDLKRLKL